MMNQVEPELLRTQSVVRLIMLLAITTVLSACGNNDIADLEEYVTQVKSREKSAIEPLPEVQTVESFVFDPSDLRNPFIPTKGAEEPTAVAVQNGIRPDMVRSREELESYALDTLRMVGTVHMASNFWGLIQANDGTIHRVRNGNYMGLNHGKIVRILEDQIELLEIIPDGPGSWRERQASVKLSE